MINEYKTEYKDYSNHIAIMISTDRSIFNEKSAVRARMIEYAKLYKELHIIIFSTKKYEKKEIPNNCIIYSTNSYFKFNYISNAIKIGKKIIKNINKRKVDIKNEIENNDKNKNQDNNLNNPILVTCQDPFETGLVGKCLVNMRKNSELLIQIHTDLFSPYFTNNCIGFKNALLNKIRLFISKSTLPQADVVRVVSVKIADSLIKRGFSKDEIILKPIYVKVDAIKNGIPSFNLHEKFPQFKKIILMVSRLETEKNIEMAIRAFASLLMLGKSSGKAVDKSDFGLLIVGSGSLDNKLKKLTHKLKISSNMAFLGWQTDLIPYYKGCDVFLMTSWYEGYGMVLKEAQAAGCKIVSTDVGIAREVEAEIVGWSEGEIAGKLEEILK